MENTNKTKVTEFVFLGLVNTPPLNALLFLIFAVIYLMTLASNATIIVIIRLDSHLHSPMYFFLCNLALLEIWYTTTIVPKMLANFLQERKTISFTGCLTQLYFFNSLGGTESVLLTVMAYDRYVAICKPLSYLVIMNNRVCLWLVAVSGFIGFMNSLVHTVLIARLSFCKTNKINHFICDIPPLLKISCSETYVNEIVVSLLGVFLILGCFLLILISYIYIISTILKIHNAESRSKAFSTCSSHLIVVTIYYGTLIYTYMRPTSSYGLYQDRVVFIIYSAVTPLLNPFIYSFRNKEVHDAFRKILKNRVRF
ncbi:olfactory receptor 1020-like [Rhinatrema bivittatum]|uniref:olfactory receptor 1020-like n=1 Tax=Rhinatrema bivittatum TaxID=194408 RepID=UPI00112902C4|nr:olfactory receptor 1020-like [Rhinatrema bivittatum]